jgi:hypothetical protein
LNLLESVRQWVLANLPYDRGDAALVAYLNGLDAGRLLIAYHNWANRFIKPQPRTVHKSKAFERNPIAAQRATDLALLVADIEAGRDLTKYLSREVVRTPARVPGGPRPDLDLMLNDWGVHHLHISSTIEADGFVQRDRPLVFASFAAQAACLIDIMHHGDWAKNHVLEVLADEWPDKGVIHKINGAMLASGRPLTDEERANLRKNGYATFFEFRGSVFMPAGGLVGTRTSLKATLAAQRLLRQIRKFEQAITQDPRCLVPDFERSGLAYPDTPDFEFAVRDGASGIVEKNTRAWISLEMRQ